MESFAFGSSHVDNTDNGRKRRDTNYNIKPQPEFMFVTIALLIPGFDF
jgi:hypothetical protein